MNVDSTHVLLFEVDSDKIVARKASLGELRISVLRSQLKRAVPMLASDISRVGLQRMFERSCTTVSELYVRGRHYRGHHDRAPSPYPAAC